jgi:hypothetical protein
MESDSDTHLTLSELCRRADSEEGFDKLLELASEIQKRLNARHYKFEAVDAITARPNDSD